MKLDQKEVEIKIKDLDGWVLDKENQAITKTYKFQNFKKAFLWMTYLSEEAERLKHHPEWRNVYNTVDVLLTTHDVSGLSTKDFDLALLMDREFKKFIE